MFGSMGGVEILIILVIGIVVFGVIKLPKIARMLGSGMSGYSKLKKGFSFEDIVGRLKGDGGDEEREPSRREQPRQPYTRETGQQWAPPPGGQPPQGWPPPPGWQPPQGWQPPPGSQPPPGWCPPPGWQPLPGDRRPPEEPDQD